MFDCGFSLFSESASELVKLYSFCVNLINCIGAFVTSGVVSMVGIKVMPSFLAA